MIKAVITIALACAGIHAQAAVETQFTPAESSALSGSLWNQAIQNYWNKIAHPTTAMHGMAIALDCRPKRIFALELGTLYDSRYKYDYSRPLFAPQTRGTDLRVRAAYWVPDGNFRANAPDADAYVRIEPFQMRRGLTTLFRKIL